jgi:hypothetical protein
MQPLAASSGANPAWRRFLRRVPLATLCSLRVPAHEGGHDGLALRTRASHARGAASRSVSSGGLRRRLRRSAGKEALPRARIVRAQRGARRRLCPGSSRSPGCALSRARARRAAEGHRYRFPRRDRERNPALPSSSQRRLLFRRRPVGWRLRAGPHRSGGNLLRRSAPPREPRPGDPPDQPLVVDPPEAPASRDGPARDPGAGCPRAAGPVARRARQAARTGAVPST